MAKGTRISTPGCPGGADKIFSIGTSFSATVKGGVVSRNHVNRPIVQTLPERLLVPEFSHGRIDFAERTRPRSQHVIGKEEIMRTRFRGQFVTAARTCIANQVHARAAAQMGNVRRGIEFQRNRADNGNCGGFDHARDGNRDAADNQCARNCAPFP